MNRAVQTGGSIARWAPLLRSGNAPQGPQQQSSPTLIVRAQNRLDVQPGNIVFLGRTHGGVRPAVIDQLALVTC
jgi:hypothetical protein